MERERKKIVYNTIKKHDGFGFNEIYDKIPKNRNQTEMSKPTFQKIVHELEDEGLIAILRSNSQKVRITANLNQVQNELLWKRYLEIVLKRIEEQFIELEQKIKSIPLVDQIALVKALMKMILLLEWRLATDSEIKKFSKQYTKRILELKHKTVILAENHSGSNYPLISMVGRSLTSEVADFSGNFDMLISNKKSEDLRSMLRVLLIQLSLK